VWPGSRRQGQTVVYKCAKVNSAVLVTVEWLEESCKQDIYHWNTSWPSLADGLEQVARGLLCCLDNWEEHGQNPFYLWGHLLFGNSNLLFLWFLTWTIVSKLHLTLPGLFPTTNYRKTLLGSMRPEYTSDRVNRRRGLQRTDWCLCLSFDRRRGPQASPK